MHRRKNMSNNKKDKSQLFVKIMALILVALMLLATAGTLIYYLLTIK